MESQEISQVKKEMVIVNSIIDSIESTMETEITPEETAKLALDQLRKQIYKEFPHAEPKVIEALLAVYGNYITMTNNEIDALPDTYTNEEIEKFCVDVWTRGKQLWLLIQKTIRDINS